MFSQSLLVTLLTLTVLLGMFGIISKVTAKGLTLSSGEEGAIHSSDSLFGTQRSGSYSDTDNSQKSLTKWLILLVGLIILVSLAVIFSPKKKLIDEIKIIEEL